MFHGGDREKQTTGRIARRAGPLVASVALVVSLVFAFLPLDPGPLVALGAVARQAAPADTAPPPPPAADPELSSVASPEDPSALPPGVVSVDGGTVSSGDVTVTLPAGAVAGPTRISAGHEGGLPDFDGEPPLRGFSIQAADADAGTPVDAFGTEVRIDLSIDLTGIDETDLSLAGLRPDGTWRVLATSHARGALSAWIDAPGTFAVVDYVPARQVTVDIAHSSDAPAEGRHRIDPGSAITVTVTLTPDATIARAELVESVPAGWIVENPGAGSWDEQFRQITWGLGKVRRGQTYARSFVVRAPLDSPADGGPAFNSTFTARLSYRGGAADARDVTILVSPPVVVEHATLGQIDDPSFEVRYLDQDAPILDAQPFDAFRVRFQLRNADAVPVTLTPQLEFRAADGGTYEPVPEKPLLGTAFYVHREWTRPPGLHGGSVLGPENEDIGTDAIRVHDTDDPDQRPTAGDRSLGQNPAAPITLPPLTYTEVEFGVRVTMDAEYLAAYDLRLTDGGAPLLDAVSATVRLGPEPALELSPGQRQGVPVDEADARGGEAPAALLPPASTGPRYALLASVATPAASPRAILAAAVVGTHGPYSPIADQCAICHSSHSAENRNVLARPAPQSTLCLSCHDGTGADSIVSAQYTDPAVPANDAAAREYYRHDALVVTSHTRAKLDEFGGAASRHSECGDCHNAHAATGTDSAETASGWTASGRLANISGVSVVNGAADTSPTYTFLDGETTPALEYELCFKCHSGFTQLGSNTGFTPSRYFLDKGVELNPANASYHPVEAAGKNTTQKMADSLSGTSPYKLWTFTTASTIRCSNCHANYGKYSLTTPPGAGSDLPPHTSRYRGILLQSYVDRVLKTSDATYSAADFALCFLCHGEAPFASGGSTEQTNFRYHELHVGELRGKGSGGTDIDTAGAGQGNAICAECHFRIHSTTYKTGTQTVTGTRLVNFAPNVLPNGVTLSWTQSGATGGSCTLRCHGETHGDYDY